MKLAPLAPFALGSLVVGTLLVSELWPRAPRATSSPARDAAPLPAPRDEAPPPGRREANVERPDLDRGLYLITGRVVDEAQAPVAGATVYIDEQAPIVTDAHGWFSIEVEAGAYGIAARKGTSCGRLDDSVEVGPDDDDDHDEPDDEPDHTIVLAPGHVLAGVVRDEDERPIAGAKVALDPDAELDEAMLGEPTQRTRADGSYRFEGICLDDVRIAVSAFGFRPQSEVQTIDADRFDVDFTLVPGALLRGLLLDFEGNPASDARVLITAVDGHTMTSLHVDEKGRFEEELPLGKLTLEAASSTGGVGRWELQLQPQETRDVTLRLRLGAGVAGVFRTASGEPLVLATVTVGSATTRTALDGTFRVIGLEPGEYDVAAYASFGVVYASSRVRLATEELKTGLVLTGRVADRTLRGRVVLLDGTPVPGVDLRVVAETGAIVQYGHTDQTGAFQIEGLLDGRCLLSASLDRARVARQSVRCDDQDVVVRIALPEP